MNQENDLMPEQTFAELLSEANMGKGLLKPGERVRARVVKISPEWVFIDLGEKNEGYLDRREFLDADNNLTVTDGDMVNVYFIKSSRNEKLFTTRITSAAAGKQFLEDAWANAIPVEGLVEKEIKGGFEIKLGGNLRGFCPYSQLTLRRVDNPAAFVGERLVFHIREYKENGRSIILTRRPILEEEREQKLAALRDTLKIGDTVTGRVVSLHKFGIFIELDGLQGMIPASEMDWDRSRTTEDLFAVGQEVTAVVAGLDWEKEKVTLSAKAALPDPWHDLPARYPVGVIREGRVTRLTDFGAFILLEPGVEGLLHISKLGQGKKIKHPREAVKEGQTIPVQVEKIDLDSRRISLVPADLGKEEAAEAMSAELYRAAVPKAMGTFSDLWPAKKDAAPTGKKRRRQG